MEKSKEKLIHDLNSAISTLSQSLQLLAENYDKEPELVSKMIPLCVDKSLKIQNDWLTFKELSK